MSTDTSQDTTTSPPIYRRLLSWLPYLLIPVIAYFAHVEYNSYLGKQAIEGTGLTIHPLDKALIKADKEEKLVLADMSAIWCPTCRRLDNEVFSDESVKQVIEKNYVFSRIEYESKEGEAFMKKYQVKGFPTLLVLDSQGNKLAQLPLTFSPAEFVSLINPS